MGRYVRAIVTVCRSGDRSAKGRDMPRDAGYPWVTSTAGGLDEWIARGKPYVTGP